MYNIIKYESSKDRIVQPKSQQEGILSGPLTSHLLVGRSGSGKSNLLVNLLKNKHFYGDWYDSVILISPTADTDDIQKQLGVKEDLTFSDLKEAPAIINKIFQLQKDKVKQLGADKAPKLCIIMDDVMSSPEFVKSPAFLSCFIKARHYNCGIFCCVQALRAKQGGFPKAALLNCSSIFCFGSSAEEIKILAELCPPGCQSNKFQEWIFQSTREPYSFIYINNKSPLETRYRKGINEYLKVDTLR